MKEKNRFIKKALVTGGAGFIGSHIVEALFERGIEEVYVVDNLSTGYSKNMGSLDKKRLHFVVGDFANIGELIPDLSEVDVIFHEAAIVSVPDSVKSPLATHDVNVNKTLQLMEYCRRKDIPRFIFASSAAVYGLDKNLVATEDLVCKPNSPYGASKLSIENYLNSYNKSYGLETVMLRYFNVYGPRQRLDSSYSGVITIFANQLTQNTSPTIFGDGKQIRDFVHVKDVARANMLAMAARNVSCEVFNVASGRSVDIIGLVLTLKSVINAQNIELKYGPPRPGDGRFGAASIQKIRTALGYKPQVEFERGLAEVVEYVKAKRTRTVAQTSVQSAMAKNARMT